MGTQLSNESALTTKAGWLVFTLSEEPSLDGQLGELDIALGGTVGRLIEAGDVTGKLSETVTLPDVPGIAADRLILLGLGKLADLTRPQFEAAVTKAVRSVTSKADQTLAIAVPSDTAGLSTSDVVETIAIAAEIGTVGQDLLKNEKGHHPLVSTILLVADVSEEVSAAVTRGTVLGQAMNETRNLVNQIAQDLYPETFANRAKEIADSVGLQCMILNKDQIVAERMGSLLGVAQGSDRDPRVVVLEYKGGGAGAETLAIVGKGVTFDCGGLSIKPTDGMLTMKCDMAGAATVVGAISAIARLKLPVNVTGYLGLVENMISGSSYKLGDILTARNNVTIEVQNTDAEGRLVLADVLDYAVERGASRIIDLATLTGACVVALGEEVTGVFSNHQDWCNDVLAAASSAGEYAWQLPTFDFYSDLLKSDVADCRNIGGRWGGAITAAKFLEKFVSDVPWVHLDIAGPSFASSNQPHREGGGTGCMVRTLVEAAANLAN